MSDTNNTATERALLLAGYVAGWHRRPFEWRASNCAHFAAGWLIELTGRNPLRNLPETPSRMAARRLVLQMGGSLADACTRVLGRSPIAAAQAQLGDIVLLPVASHPASGALAVCGGRMSAALTQEAGVVWLPTASAVAAWRVGPAA